MLQLTYLDILFYAHMQIFSRFLEVDMLSQRIYTLSILLWPNCLPNKTSPIYYLSIDPEHQFFYILANICYYRLLIADYQFLNFTKFAGLS